MAVAGVLRAMIDQIILTPDNRVLLIDVRGDLAGILNISLERKKPAKKAASLLVGTSGFSNLRQSKVEVVAGVGFEPTTFRL
jgi:site-specific DNA recombinase